MDGCLDGSIRGAFDVDEKLSRIGVRVDVHVRSSISFRSTSREKTWLNTFKKRGASAKSKPLIFGAKLVRVVVARAAQRRPRVGDASGASASSLR